MENNEVRATLGLDKPLTDDDRRLVAELTAAPAEDPIFGPVISEYGVGQAVDEGVLVDVTEWAREKGHPAGSMVVMTRTVWSQYVEMPPRIKAQGWQSERARAGDILWMSFLAIASAVRAGRVNSEGGRVPFIVLVKNRAGEAPPSRVRLDAHLDPGGVVTIMLPEED